MGNVVNITEEQAAKFAWRIKDKTIEACIDLIQSDLWRYQSDMNRAYTLNPGNLEISLKLKISPEEGNRNKIENGISFTIEKLAEKGEPVYVSEDQMSLDFK